MSSPAERRRQQLTAMSELSGIPTRENGHDDGGHRVDQHRSRRVRRFTFQPRSATGTRVDTSPSHDNGSGITGCGAVPLDLAGSCDTSSLSVGRPTRSSSTTAATPSSGASASPPVDVVVSLTPRPVGPPAIPGPGQVVSRSVGEARSVAHTSSLRAPPFDRGTRKPPVVQRRAGSAHSPSFTCTKHGTNPASTRQLQTSPGRWSDPDDRLALR